MRGGVAVPLFTPLDADGAVDRDGIQPLVQRALRAGVDALVALGTTGEFADLTRTERAQVGEAVVTAAANQVPVLVGVGALGTAEACALARDAQAAGAAGVLALPPLYWNPGPDSIVGHYARIAEATGLPLYLYDFPALSGTPLTPAVIARVVNEVPGIAGIKLSGSELRVVHGVLGLVKGEHPDFAVLIGAADLVLPALLAGADGAIVALANVFPEPFVCLRDAVLAGDHAAAISAHRRILELGRVTGQSSPPVLALKAAANALGSPVRPVVRTDPDDPDRVRAAAATLARDLWG